MKLLNKNRKFIIMASIIVISATLCKIHLLSSADFTSLLSAVGVAFMGGNAVEHWASTKAPAGKEPQSD